MELACTVSAQLPRSGLVQQILSIVKIYARICDLDAGFETPADSFCRIILVVLTTFW
jgi:hypothetical protein